MVIALIGLRRRVIPIGGGGDDHLISEDECDDCFTNDGYDRNDGYDLFITMMVTIMFLYSMR